MIKFTNFIIFQPQILILCLLAIIRLLEAHPLPKQMKKKLNIHGDVAYGLTYDRGSFESTTTTMFQTSSRKSQASLL